MLVLTRKIGEDILIGEQNEIIVRIIGISGCQVRVGIAAPRSIPILRAEISQKEKLHGPHQFRFEYPEDAHGNFYTVREK